jgi:peptidoglycan/LPS O-acetylase OafA/YrhL
MNIIINERESKSRLAVFDLLRVFAISLILISHISIMESYKLLFNQTPDSWIGHVFFWDIGSIGMLIFLCISGAVLELNKKPMNTTIDFVKHMFKRLVRIYPAYWMSLLFVIFLYLYVNVHYFGDLFWQFSGFSAFVNQWGGLLNPVAWCISLFVVLYTLFPLISKAMEQRPFISLVILFILSMATTYWINTTIALTQTPNAFSFARWFPLCNLFYFGLGVFVVRKRIYPTWQDRTGILPWLGALSFYVFLFHLPIIGIITAGIPIYLAFTVLISIAAMILDAKIQEWIRGLIARRVGKQSVPAIIK